MNLQKCFALKIGDKIVQVRKSYQNYDHSRVPCEPRVYTISWTGSGDKGFKETVRRSFWHSDDKVLYGGTTGEVPNGCIVSDYETMEDYISGNYNKDITIDKSKYKDLEDFLVQKAETDYIIAKEIEDKRYQVLKEKHGS